jgi:hypothetical protein
VLETERELNLIPGPQSTARKHSSSGKQHAFCAKELFQEKFPSISLLHPAPSIPGLALYLVLDQYTS